MDKIFEMLGIEKLDESKQTQLKETLQTVIEAKSQEMAESKVEELLEGKKEELTEEYESKFDEYKESVTTKFSNFVDSILEEEMVIPENVIKYAHLGEVYEGLIEQFKVRLAIDEGMINGEVKGMLKEAKEEIETLRSKVDESTGKVLEVEKDATEMAAQLYIRSKCDGLTESQKTHVVNILGDELIKENIDKKFKIIVDTMNFKINESDDDKDDDDKGGDDKDDDDKDVVEMKCSECGNEETIKEADGDDKCPECGAKMTKVKATNEGKGKVVVDGDEDDQNLNEDAKPWDVYKDIWVNTLKG